jgi:cell division septation protein DedD
MPRNEDGEFELVLGNRQLLSVFFLVVILMSVFFLMGYIVGRNSAPATIADTTPTRPSRPVVVDSPTRPGEKPAEKPAETPKEEAKPEPPPKPVEVEKKEEPKPEPKREKEKEKKKAAEPPPTHSNKPVAGATYLQIAAVDEKAAEVMVSTLRQKNFSALSVQVPEKPNLFRVFVGPYPDSSALADAKAKLTAAGFRGNEAIRKVF